jgi:LIM domain kinase 1
VPAPATPSSTLNQSATYLGINVAIKEVLPSKDYDVSKYFEREWRLMRFVHNRSRKLLFLMLRATNREARHPNVVLYIALSRAPQPDNRIFIISEFIENGKKLQTIIEKDLADQIM